MALDFGSMFDNELNGLKGWYPGQDWNVDKQLPVNTTSIIGTEHYVAGKVVHVKRGLTAAESPSFNLGLPVPSRTTEVSAALPFILFGGANDFDVAGASGNFTSAVTTGENTFGNENQVKAVCANQAAELETTAWVAGDYLPGDLLTAHGTIDAATDTAVKAENLGKITKVTENGVPSPTLGNTTGTAAGVIVVGVVTEGQSVGASSNTNEHGVGVLRFHTWPQAVFADATS